MNCCLLVVLLIVLINNVYAANDDHYHRLTNAPYNKLLTSDKSCSRIWYCDRITDHDCFIDCYDMNNRNQDSVNLCGSRDYVNPFKNSNCGKATRAYLNYYSANCYTTPYRSTVINRAGARIGTGLKIINNRCLTGAGWCECNVPKTSNDRCGKVNNGIYECKSGYCCSKWGHCGKTSDYCGYGCQTPFGKCW